MRQRCLLDSFDTHCQGLEVDCGTDFVDDVISKSLLLSDQFVMSSICTFFETMEVLFHFVMSAVLTLLEALEALFQVLKSLFKPFELLLQPVHSLVGDVKTLVDAIQADEDESSFGATSIWRALWNSIEQTYGSVLRQVAVVPGPLGT